MTKQPRIGRTITCLCCMAFAGISHAQWIAETGDYDADENWAAGVVPDLGTATIANGGVAILDGPAPDLTGLVIGQLPNSGNGTLLLNSGASLFVDIDATGNGGNTRVGRSSFLDDVGFGLLSIERGAELFTETLTSGGDPDSAIVLGAGGSSGMAALLVNDVATLSRNLEIVGPDVDFNPFILDLQPAHRYTAGITGDEHAVITVDATATLGGSSFHADFGSFTPDFGDSWTLLDADEVIGEFSQPTANGLPTGAGVFLSYENGGENGEIVELSIAPRLNISVDRSTGNVTLENRSPLSVSIDGYSFEGIDGADSSASVTLAPESSLDLGEIYEFSPSTIGELEPGVALSYDSGADVIASDVEFIGNHNNLVLLVDPTTGEAAIQNQSGFAVDVDGYAIYSLSGSIDQEAWDGLAEGGNSEWASVNPSNVHVAELNLNSSTGFGASSGPLSVGAPFDFDGEGAEQDLVFEFHLAGVGTVAGVVEYGSFEVSDDPLDCNLDGSLNRLDLSCIIASGGPAALNGLLDATGLLPGDLDGDGTVAFADFLTLSSNFGSAVGSYPEGDVDGDGTVSFADFLTVSGNFGQSSAAVASVPEPASYMLSAFGLLSFLQLRRRRRSVRAVSVTSTSIAMPNRTLGIASLVLTTLLVGGLTPRSDAQTLMPIQQIFVADSSDRDLFDPGTDPGPLDEVGDIVVRERVILNQDSRQIRSFLEFDVSSISPEAVANPNWSARFLVDFVTRLNDVNDMSVVIGRVLDDSHPLTLDGDEAGDSWTTEEGSLPLFEWGRTAAESADPEFTDDIVLLIDNVRIDPFGTEEADVTDIVASWVDGTFENNGFVLSGNIDIPQGAGLANARLIVGAPGDFDGDGLVNFADFLILGNNFLSHLDGPVTAGDIDFDGDVDLDDFGQFKTLFSQAQGAAVAASSVPEPSAAVLCLFAMLACLRFRSARSR